jgi:hypothetical protein
MVAVILAAAAAASPPDAPGWVHGAAATGVDAIGMGETGAVAIGMAVTGTAIGVIIMVTTVWSSSAISAFQGGGAGAGDIQDITATDIRTAITGMVILTVTVMATAGMDPVTTATVMAMDMAIAQAANTALPLGRE